MSEAGHRAESSKAMSTLHVYHMRYWSEEEERPWINFELPQNGKNIPWLEIGDKPTKAAVEASLPVEAPRMEDEDTPANPAVDASETMTMPLESLPMEPVPLESSPVAPGADATRLAETADATRLAETLEPPVHLPFPYNTMNPADEI